MYIHYNWGEPERAPHLPYVVTIIASEASFLLRSTIDNLWFNGPDFRYVYIYIKESAVGSTFYIIII